MGFLKLYCSGFFVCFELTWVGSKGGGSNPEKVGPRRVGGPKGGGSKGGGPVDWKNATPGNAFQKPRNVDRRICVQELQSVDDV